MSRKKTYSNELKLKVVKKYIEGKYSYKDIADEFYCNKCDVIKWVAAYRKHGVSGLCTTHETYTGDFKVTVVKYIKNTGASLRQTAAHFNIPSSPTIGKWERIYYEQGKEALYINRRGRPRGMNNKNHMTVQKLIIILQLKCMVRIKKYRSYKGEIGEIAPNIINRDFKAPAPNQKWTTDITEFTLFGAKLYLSPILDMYNGEIVSYNISKRPVLGQVMDMLVNAFEKKPGNSKLIFHSDQGWQYQHKQYQKRLKDKGIRQSMSRKGNCLDNSVMETFFGLLKS